MEGIIIDQKLAEVDTLIHGILRSKDTQMDSSMFDFPEKKSEYSEKQLQVTQSLHKFSESLAESLSDFDQQWKAGFQLAKRNFQEYVTLVHLAYRNSPAILHELRIGRAAPDIQQEWLDHARYFYTKVPAYNTLLEQQFGLYPEVWAQALAEIHALVSARHQLLHYRTEVLQVTQQLEDALIELE